MGLFNFVSNFEDTILGPLIDNTMRSAGQAGVEEARRVCPVETGQLRDSIGYIYDQKTRICTLYADKSYASFVNFGYRTRSGRVVPGRRFLDAGLTAMGRTWGGTVEVQLPMLAPQYHARTVRFTNGKVGTRFGKKARLVLGHKEGRP